MLGNRDSYTARVFIQDLKARLSNRIQLTTEAERWMRADLVCGTAPQNALAVSGRL